ncbi:signal recognition particle-docking protein FtsY [Thermanaerothrix sp. 4228-RoL]|uniref:Signal recognition particle receptor FtsY n=2 Tax=Thermanaerothrix TaxID=1077886 RepID=A0ABU3NKM2_9CHLR|nr:signal recognition particle-docking protein FtsY [Thermanaerothrix sp. 4228-RoL]MDT8896763.1 signal recognition particle-docking protein FtsY [Thermanaerothrix sp. 4228-RoL]
MIDLINKWKQGLERTRKATFGRLAALLGVSEIDDSTWEDLEALLLQSDLGVETTQEILQSLRQRVQREGLTKAGELKQALREELLKRLDTPPILDLDSHQPAVILVVGVNGSGKTTTIAKLAQWFRNQNKKVLLVAADTFRAAAVDQLQVWAERLNLPIVAGQPNADPGAVTFDGIQAALARKTDIVLIDTAGRLHTRYNLMEELKKVHRVAGKALPGAPHAVWLVLDATTGQNALQQARAFKEAVNVNGIILAKLDSSARGGMAFAIQSVLGIPILFVGLGETPSDLEIFDPEAFVQGILEG